MEQLKSKAQYEEIINKEILTVVDFYADWCPPCKMLAPVMQELYDKYNQEGKVAIAKVNVDELNEVAALNDVQSIPTIIFFKEGKELWRRTGYLDFDSLDAKISSLM